MGKNKIFDHTDYPRALTGNIKKRKLSLFLGISFCLWLFYSGCAFPRIIVLEDPLMPEEHLNLGVAYEKDGELESAIKEYQLAAQTIPASFFYLGNAYFRKKELNKAEEYYKIAIKKEAHTADAYNNLAWLYCVKREKLDEAESLVLKAMELNPSKKDIYSDTLEKIRTFKNSNI